MSESTAPESVGERIKRARLERGMKQHDLAAAVGVGVPHISKVEAGLENASDDLLARIAVELDCDHEELMIAARRLPADVMEILAHNPTRSVRWLNAVRATRP